MENQSFDERSTKQPQEAEMTNSHHLGKKLDAVGWGLFFIWVGIAFLANLGYGVGLLGVGVITLGGQVARKCFNLRLEGFWVVVGLLFVLGGLWELFEPKVSLVPILLIVVGLVWLLSAIRGKRAPEGCSK
ncbi:MAG: hypothetical protein AMJ91_01045 [candidate division Zixibacteria bacterium SM23_73_3]|nr:MAG: hypothetical protein AMJ91_01045 [candidate division Zixibacteria bacterium SM23_73_3]